MKRLHFDAKRLHKTNTNWEGAKKPSHLNKHVQICISYREQVIKYRNTIFKAN